MFAFAKNKQIMVMIEEYLRIANECMENYVAAVKHLAKKGVDDHFEVLAAMTHQSESNADDSRRLIETEMYRKSLLPETREDILLTIELLDRVPSTSSRCAIMFAAIKANLDQQTRNGIVELAKMARDGFAMTTAAFKACLGISKDDITDLARRVDNLESLGDKIEREQIGKIFSEKIDVGEKLLRRDIIERCGEPLNLCEKSMDRIVILHIKRQI